VWGSEFTSKDAAIKGGVGEIAARLNVKFWVLVPDLVVASYPYMLKKKK
jgi:hypothetical protein